MMRSSSYLSSSRRSISRPQIFDAQDVLDVYLLMASFLGPCRGSVRLSRLTTESQIGLQCSGPERMQETVVVQRKAGLGSSAAIAPWYWPLLLGVGKFGPAVLAVTTVIIKPSPYAPNELLRIGELAAQIFAPGVVQVLSGDKSLGP